MYDSILVATDGSDDATTAADHAVGLARRLEVPLYGIAVIESRIEYDNAIVDPAEIDRRRRERTDSSLSKLEKAADDVGVTVETTVRSGVPHEEILEYADDCDAGAIVVGSRGRSSFRRALLGSTVDAVVRLAVRPVIVIESED
ncbi:universal stress protein [Natrarchaeobius halalkaliphilus]|uniref:Universal stress protein n=1 Tax=Natrarchaeobius halalkaliphilus TaxID=1679091 RepID=A0A3N6MXS6_9EURY|nr:universal stress protein [Natrarchaeobius halalkaliphilus]RQG90332.1 universal stress protein [Natrarchaeobius halalkaliphilus]